MADRFPLIVNAVTNKIEEIRSGDNLDLTGNGISVNGSTGSAGQYLKTDGSTILWDNPGDVYLNQTQTLTNKTLETCVISGSLNTLTNIPNSALDNSGITVNGTTIPLGESVITPDNNTTYSVSAVDGLAATEKIIRLTSGGNAGAGVTDDVSIIAGTNVTLSRTNDAITAKNGLSLKLKPGQSYSAFLNTYDAGVEVNTESCNAVPAPPCNSHNVGETENGIIKPHVGILGLGDLDLARDSFAKEAAKLTIKRIK